MALRQFLTLRKPRSGCLEGRTAPVQPLVNSFIDPQPKRARKRTSRRMRGENNLGV